MNQKKLEAINHKKWKSFFSIFIIITTIYLLWLIAFWPGALGQDSLAIIYEIEKGNDFSSGKTVFWYYFVKFFYTPSHLVEIPIGVQLLISSIIFSRILSWCREEKMRKTFFFIILFIALAPHMILFIGTLYPDGIFSVAAIGILFESWLISKDKKLNALSILIITICLPFAIFARSNGIIFLFVIFGSAFFLKKIEKILILSIILIWCTAIFIRGKQHKSIQHGVLYPLALYETVNFLQPRPMGLWREKPRVSEKTILLLTQNQPLEKILANYDRDYWDPLVHKPDGPLLYSLNKKTQKIIVHEFFYYNLWQNLPSFISSRVNIFLVSAFAEGGLPSITYSAYIIPSTESKSEYRKFKLTTLESNLFRLSEWTQSYRWIFWSPFLGIILLFYSFF